MREMVISYVLPGLEYWSIGHKYMFSLKILLRGFWPLEAVGPPQQVGIVAKLRWDCLLLKGKQWFHRAGVPCQDRPCPPPKWSIPTRHWVYCLSCSPQNQEDKIPTRFDSPKRSKSPRQMCFILVFHAYSKKYKTQFVFEYAWKTSIKHECLREKNEEFG